MGRISMPQGKGSQMHNLREYGRYDREIPDNIDSSLTSQNLILVHKEIKQAYREIFGEALAKYNRKQKRADRRIADYYDHIKKSKNGEKPFYEDIVQWGSKADFEDPQTREKAKEALVMYVEGFEQRNPNLKLIGAYIHMDEASPHLHLDYIPVATGYSIGLEKRNSLDKAMKQMGFRPEKESRKNNATKLWKEHERVVFGDICRDLGLEVEAERKARGSLSVEEYKDARDKMIGGIEQERDAIVATVDRLQDLETYINDEIDKLDDQKNKLRDQRDALAEEKGRLEAQTEPLKREYEAVLSEIKPLKELKTEIAELSDTGKVFFPGVVILKKKEFEQIQEQAKAYAANRDEIETLRQRVKDVDLREEKVTEREKRIDNIDFYERNAKRRYLELIRLKQDIEKEKEEKDKEIKNLKQENSSLKSKIKALTMQLEETKQALSNKTKEFTERLKTVYQSLASVVKAVRTLKYDKTGSYKIRELSKKQEYLIDGVAEYSAKLAKKDNFPELATDIETHYGIDKGIQNFVEPPAPKRARDYDHER